MGLSRSSTETQGLAPGTWSLAEAARSPRSPILAHGVSSGWCDLAMQGEPGVQGLIQPVAQPHTTHLAHVTKKSSTTGIGRAILNLGAVAHSSA